MRYMKEFKLFESKLDIESICEEYGIRHYTINDDDSIDVDGNVELCGFRLTELPLNFNKVTGDFDCHYNKLTTLEGCPKEVGGNFVCYNNKLTSLKGCPTYIGGDFYFSINQLTSLEGCPESVGGDFDCSWNDLTTLEVCPTSVGGVFLCGNNKIITLGNELEDVVISGGFDIEDNHIYDVYRIFNDFKKFKMSLDWNYFVEPGKPIIERYSFEQACLEQGIEMPDKIKGYKFI